MKEAIITITQFLQKIKLEIQKQETDIDVWLDISHQGELVIIGIASHDNHEIEFESVDELVSRSIEDIVSELVQVLVEQ